jgi:hypothetical protein
MTPEGKIKAKIDKLLKKYSYVYYHKPVMNGMGAPTLDYVGCANGRYFAIEAKAAGKTLTDRQRQTMLTIEAAGGDVFLISNDAQLEFLTGWLDAAC